ncbi:MAG TPA: DinB family protein [Terriglobales bacterium]|nr:DinB family protein [Terriglobales bacterium]
MSNSTMRCLRLSVILLSFCIVATAQSPALSKLGSTGEEPAPADARTVRLEADHPSTTPLDAEKERQALLILLKSVRGQIVSAAEAMPATKYEFVPSDGEFKGVRTFAKQVRHLSATNHILAAAALGEQASNDIDENGPETVRTKTEILEYLNSSFDHLTKAIEAIGDPNAPVKASPISPLPESKTTRLALTVEALIHAFNHYGQMVEYLRMNGIIPPASRP